MVTIWFVNKHSPIRHAFHVHFRVQDILYNVPRSISARGVFMLQMSTLLFWEPCWLSVKNLRFPTSRVVGIPKYAPDFCNDKAKHRFCFWDKFYLHTSKLRLKSLISTTSHIFLLELYISAYGGVDRVDPSCYHIILSTLYSALSKQ